MTKKKSKERATKRSQSAYEKAQTFFPGGVNSPVRSWKSVGLNDQGPFFVLSAKGAYLTDIDGNQYIDFVGSWGPMILGHANTKVVAAIRKQAARGASFGAPTELETRLGVRVKKAYPSMERMRFVSSGSEAVMHALRVARGFTNRPKILKFEGCYHGASDSVLVKAGSGAATFGVPDSAGVPVGVAGDTLTVPYNDLSAAQEVLEANQGQVAAIVVEPVVGNSGVLIPEEGFLEGLADLAKASGSLLIFDEVMTGFRLAGGGAQERFGIRPDLTTLGKIIGGGLPCAAYGGRADIMEKVAPLGPVYQAGTLSGNPLAMAAGIATLDQLQKKSVYQKLEEISERVENVFREAAALNGWDDRICINRVGSMFTIFFTQGPVRNFADAKAADGECYARFFQGMLEGGVYMAPSPFEAAFVNLAMGPKVIKRVARAARDTFSNLY